jgi:predicted CoA-binding protein
MLYADASLKTLLSPGKTIALVGAKDRPGTEVDMVGRYLIAAGFRVVPVHPARARGWDLPACKALEEVAGPIASGNLFRAPGHCPDHAAEVLALAKRPAGFWMQTGIVSPGARELLAGSGIEVVEDRCIMVEPRRLWG